MSPLRIEFHHPAEPAEPASTPPGPRAPPPPPLPAVASATWTDDRAVIGSDDPAIRASLERAFRPTPVVIDDPSLRYPGTHGDLMLQPGDLEWFRAVAQFRVAAETGLVARSVPGVRAGGYDPAANYRPFSEQIERLESR
ncbi:MAG: hypothetical protein ACRDG8_12145 [Actinomycetota bacterium]